MAIETENTGKMFEMAICLAYGIEYDGKYKYGLDLPNRLKPKLMKLTRLFPTCKHTAKKGSRYDYTSIDELNHLSAKSTKKGVGKVSPQVVGQAQPKKFCDIIGIEYTTIQTLKHYIQSNILNILPILVDYTFECPTVYYNQQLDTIRYITLEKPIDWSVYSFRWTSMPENWRNSCTLKILCNGKEIPILEFQFHTKSRTNMAIRWCYENFLTVFKDNLNIILLETE